MKENVIQKKSFEYALKIIELYRHLVGASKEFIISKQVLRSGTAIGASVEEAIGGQSKKELLFECEELLKIIGSIQKTPRGASDKLVIRNS